MLFVAASLILPNELKPDEDLRDSFEHTRWAVTVVAVFKASATALNWWAFDAWPLSRDGLINGALLASAVGFALVRTRWMEWVATIVFATVLFGTVFLIG